MLSRRAIFGATAAAASLLTTPFTRKAAATTSSYDLEPRGTTGRLERLPKLDLESQDDFLTAFRVWVGADLSDAARARAAKVLEKKGLDPEAAISKKQALALLGDDPLIGTRFLARATCQQLTWDILMKEFHDNADQYLAEMEAADYSGPGKLELNPEMDIPEYTRHEIHAQPGGYVGDPFAGHVYHYGTNNFYKGRNYQDELHDGIAKAMPGPVGGSVRRILDMGCSCGQLTVALKERFPEAEVWGVDIGGPMVRYAHMRAVDLGVDVNFAQRLAEDTRFPDGHFDIVTSYILHHEVTEEASKKIIREAYRVLRPGGVFYPVDFFTASRPRPKTAYEQVVAWWSHRWNVEVWRYDYENLDYVGEMRKTGFDVDENGPPSARYAGPNLLGVKRG